MKNPTRKKQKNMTNSFFLIFAICVAKCVYIALLQHYLAENKALLTILPQQGTLRGKNLREFVQEFKKVLMLLLRRILLM